MTFLGDRKFLPWECGDMWPGARMRDLLIKVEEGAPCLEGTFDLQNSLRLGPCAVCFVGKTT